MTTPVRPASTPPRAPAAGAAAATGPVRTQDIPRTPWNFFVYLNGDNNLESDAKDDLNEMEKLGSMPGRMNVFALVDGATGSKVKDGYVGNSDGWSAGTRLMWIQKDPANSKQVVSREVQVDPKSDLGKLMAAGKGELNLGDPKVANAALKCVQQNVPPSTSSWTCGTTGTAGGGPPATTRARRWSRSGATCSRRSRA